MVHYSSDFRKSLKEIIIHILKSNPEYYFSLKELKKISGKSISLGKFRKKVKKLEEENMVELKKVKLDEKQETEKAFKYLIKWSGYL